MQNGNALIARVCHDLITPFNAINLGLEAFEMSNDQTLLTTIRESVDKANSIMKYTREMFIERPESFCYSSFSLQQLIADFLSIYKISFQLESDMDNIANIAAKIMMYMSVVAKEIMPYGGHMCININDELGEIITKCTGKDIIIPNMPEHKEVNHRNIIRYELMQLLKEAEFTMNISQEDTSVIFNKKIN